MASKGEILHAGLDYGQSCHHSCMLHFAGYRGTVIAYLILEKKGAGPPVAATARAARCTAPVIRNTDPKGGAQTQICVSPIFDRREKIANPNPALTATNIRYLLVIRELDVGERGARYSDVAKVLGVTKPSVTTMIGTLRGFGLVTKEKHGMVHLTKIGREKATWYAACLELLFPNLKMRWGHSESITETPPVPCSPSYQRRICGSFLGG